MVKIEIGITDESVIEEMKKRNPDALEYIMEKYGGSLYRLAYRILNGTGSPEDIEECVSDTFLEAWNTIEDYDAGKGSFKTWLSILQKYKALDYRRKLLKKAGKSSFDDIDQHRHIPSGFNVEKDAMLRESVRELAERLDTFDRTDRAVFLKRYFYYQGVESIARQLGITRASAYKRLWKGRNTLKQYFERRGWMA